MVAFDFYIENAANGGLIIDRGCAFVFTIAKVWFGAGERRKNDADIGEVKIVDGMVVHAAATSVGAAKETMLADIEAVFKAEEAVLDDVATSVAVDADTGIGGLLGHSLDSPSEILGCKWWIMGADREWRGWDIWRRSRG